MPVHTPILLNKVIELFEPNREKIFVDATIGEGGHAKNILSYGSCVIGIDWDFEILLQAEQNLKDFNKRLKLICGNFKNLCRFIKIKVDGLLFDLGFSLWHIKAANRGFTFQKEEPLDMRFCKSSPTTAYKIVNETQEKELARIIQELGEEKHAKRIARQIVKHRPIENTLKLAEIIHKGYTPSRPRKYTPLRKKRKIHPATKTFQAIRIATNKELENIKEALSTIDEILKEKARCIVISYHSLEDRLVKNIFKGFAKQGYIILTKKPISAAPCAKLRCIQKQSHF